MKLFAERGVLSMRYKDCETPLHRIYKHNYYKQPWLLEFGGDPNVHDCLGRTPLHHAAAEGRGLEPLLEAGADPNARDKDGKTPLHYAVTHRRSDAVKLLLEYGAEVDGETALHIAAAGCRYALAQLLVQHGADGHLDHVSPEVRIKVFIPRKSRVRRRRRVFGLCGMCGIEAAETLGLGRGVCRTCSPPASAWRAGSRGLHVYRWPITHRKDCAFPGESLTCLHSSRRQRHPWPWTHICWPPLRAEPTAACRTPWPAPLAHAVRSPRPGETKC